MKALVSPEARELVNVIGMFLASMIALSLFVYGVRP